MKIENYHSIAIYFRIFGRQIAFSNRKLVYNLNKKQPLEIYQHFHRNGLVHTMNELYEVMQKLGYLRNGHPNTSAIAKAPISELIDFTFLAGDLTQLSDLQPERSIFSYSASLSLGGGPSPCEGLQCRLKKIRELAQFTALYSDKVFISNYITDHQPNIVKNGYDNINEENLRWSLINDIHILSEIRPLVDAGRIILVTPPHHICLQCLADLGYSAEINKRFEDEEEKLARKYIESISIKVSKKDEFYIFDCEGPEELLEHGSQCITYDSTVPDIQLELKKISKVLDRLETKQGISLAKSYKNKLSIPYEMASEATTNILFAFMLAQCVKTSFLTERQMHIDLLSSISSDPTLQRKNQIVQKHLTSFVPFVNEIELKDLIKLRTSEEEAFIMFRKSLNAAIDEMKNLGDDFSERDAQTIYSDLIAPKLANLDLKIKSAKRTFNKTIRRDVLSWTAAISFGMYTGFLSNDLLKTATALGLTKVMSDLLNKSMSQSDNEEAIRNEDMYFLWKVRQKSAT